VLDSPPIALGTLPRLLGLLACLAALAVPATAAANAPPLRGAATHPLWPDNSAADFTRELDMLKATGANTVRIDIGWATLEENGKGQVNTGYVQKADIFFALAAQRGLKVVVGLFTTPCWASSAPDSLKLGCSAGWWDRGVGYYPPVNMNDFADAAAYVAQRWGDKMAALEVWNEPNYSDWFRSATPGTPAPPATYVAMLKASYARIKQVRPSLPVLGPAMLASDGVFLEALYAAGIKGYFDGLSLRPFSDGRSPYDLTVPAGGISRSYLWGVPTIRNIMVAHGDAAKRMWFTELGWSSCYPGPSAWCITPALQAQYLADAFRIIRDRWDYVESVSVYNLRNKGTDPLDRETQMGLLYRDFTPKPSYYAFRDVIAEMIRQPYPPPPPPPPVPPDQTRPKLSRLKVKIRGARTLVVSWRQSEPARVSLRLERATARAQCKKKCIRWPDKGRLTVKASRRGPHRARLKLPRNQSGRFRLTATARDRAGNRSVPKRVWFRPSKLRR
jgi:polysaccharide biosynthesis protein PslG